MQIEYGNTYWGYVGTREFRRKVNFIDRRESGTKYVNWTSVKKDGTEGASGWTELTRFKSLVKGLYEKGENNG